MSDSCHHLSEPQIPASWWLQEKKITHAVRSLWKSCADPSSRCWNISLDEWKAWPAEWVNQILWESIQQLLRYFSLERSFGLKDSCSWHDLKQATNTWFRSRFLVLSSGPAHSYEGRTLHNAHWPVGYDVPISVHTSCPDQKTNCFLVPAGNQLVPNQFIFGLNAPNGSKLSA